MLLCKCCDKTITDGILCNNCWEVVSRMRYETKDIIAKWIKEAGYQSFHMINGIAK